MIKALEQYTKTYKKDSHIENGQDMNKHFTKIIISSK